MSDYTQITDFSAKDALTTGDPEKIILGSDMDAELDAVSTAVATKYDSSDLASQGEAEAGSSNTKLITPLRAAQAIAALESTDASDLDTGTLPDARLSSNVPLKDASNTFTGSANNFGNADGEELGVYGATGHVRIIGYSPGQTGTLLYVRNAADSGYVDFTVLANDIVLTGASVVLNGVNSSDFARLSQSNTFTGAEQHISNSGSPLFRVTDTTDSASVYMQVGGGEGYVGTQTSHPFNVITNNANRISISAAGAIDFNNGAVLAETIANSDSETLAAGQLHFIDANATLPNLPAGQWIEVINDSASPITISKNGSDTTYWSLTGATVSTSFTLAARGRLSAVCNPAGSSVYVAGSGITGAT
jgi:hypothetical protein